jgi:hypothetical protein
MRRRIQEAIGRAEKLVVTWGRTCWHEATTCRECNHVVRLLDDTCPHCGAGHPARVRISAVAILLLPIWLLLAYACM